MLSRLYHLPRRCSSQRRFYSKGIESLHNEVTSNNEVKVNLDSPKMAAQQSSHAYTKPIDQRLQMQRLRNNFVAPGPGLKSSRNRNDLVAEFFDLSKSVLEGRLTLNELKDSETFLRLEEQLNFHIDIMSNNQVINMVASLVKMKFDSSSNILRLLEHEVKFRINSLTLLQVMKLMKFYNSIETSYEQKQVTDVLNNRLRSTLLSTRTTLGQLLDIYRHLVELNGQSKMLSTTEEKMLSLLTFFEQDEDDVVSQYLPRTSPYSYDQLCNIFVELASVKRRPTPLLKAASQVLYKLPLPTESQDRPDISLLISTLNSLAGLNYTNRLLVGKLITDLTEVIDLNELTLTTQCNLLRIIGSLKWRSEKLLNLFYEYIKINHDDQKKVDHNMLLTLFHVTANLNYKPDGDIVEFYNKCMRGSRESIIDRKSRKWLNYVWSLAVLNVATDEHFDSVLNDDYIRAIENPLNLQKMYHADVMKLLNLRTIAKIENRTVPCDSELLDELAKVEIQRGADLEKFASKVKDALIGVVKSSENLPNERQTPFGFVVNCGLSLNSEQEIEALDSRTVDFDLTTIVKREAESRDNGAKIALIYVLFDEALASHPNEPVGHKKIISRILDGVGFRTVFIQEVILNRHKTSADLASGIKEMINQAKSENSYT